MQLSSGPEEGLLNIKTFLLYLFCGFGIILVNIVICTTSDQFFFTASVLHEQEKSQAKISRQTGVSRCGIQALLKKHQETGQVEDKPRSGWPRKLTNSDEKYLKVTSLRDRKKNKQGSCRATCSNFGDTNALIYDTKNSRTERSSW